MKDPANRDTAIVYPLRRKKDPFVGPDALMAMTPADVHALKKILKLREIPMIDVGLCRFYQAEKESPGPALTLVGPILGAPQAVIAMEKLIVLGAKRIWILGWCGSLQPGLSIGDLVVPVRAVSEEGTSRHYPVGERDRLLSRTEPHAGGIAPLPWTAFPTRGGLDDRRPLPRDGRKGNGLSGPRDPGGGDGNVRADDPGPVPVRIGGRAACGFGRTL